jgi:hypothetical protein
MFGNYVAFERFCYSDREVVILSRQVNLRIVEVDS